MFKSCINHGMHNSSHIALIHCGMILVASVWFTFTILASDVCTHFIIIDYCY